MAEVKQLSRSEREAQIKDKAGMVICILAALLAINTLVGGSNSSKILNNTIEANNTWAFFQAKSIKQTLAEMAYDDAVRSNDKKKSEALKSKIDRYESDPKTGEGKVELMAKDFMEKTKNIQMPDPKDLNMYDPRSRRGGRGL